MTQTAWACVTTGLLLGLALGCSSSDSSGGGGAKAVGGQAGATSDAAPDTGTGGKTEQDAAGDATNTPDGASGSAGSAGGSAGSGGTGQRDCLKEAECRTCCLETHPAEYDVLYAYLLACACKPGICDEACATTACADPPTEADEACGDCGGDALDGACKSALNQCLGDSKCKALVECALFCKN